MQVVERWDIHLLRAVAIGAVFAYHTGFPHAGGGSLGVDVFFVLSGYLITVALLRGGSRRAFYRKRLARTVPAAAVVMVAVTVAALIVAPAEWEQLRWHLLASATWTENVLVTMVTAGDLQGVMSLTPYTHYWSLAMEEQFYLVWPWVVAGFAALGLARHRRLGLTLTLLAVIAGSLWLYCTWAEQSHAVAYFSPLARVWQLAAGALLAVWLPRMSARFPRYSWLPGLALGVFVVGVGLLLWAVAVGGFVHDTDSPLWGVLVVVVTATLVATGRWLKPLPRPVRRALLPVWAIGTISYGLYLWHLPVIWTLVNAGMSEHTPQWWLVVVSVSVGAAALSWRYIERPSIAWARRSARPTHMGAPAPRLHEAGVSAASS